METLIVGDPLDKNTDIGAINSAAQLERSRIYLSLGQEEGAEMYQSPSPVPGTGYWCRPTLLSGVSQSNRVVQEEIFGPVLAIQTFRTFEEGLPKANNTPYGLSGGVWTDKGAKIFKMTAKIRAGVSGPIRSTSSIRPRHLVATRRVASVVKVGCTASAPT